MREGAPTDKVAIITGASIGIGKKHMEIIVNPIALASPAGADINWKPTGDQDRD
jgi:hypothetical protein